MEEHLSAEHQRLATNAKEMKREAESYRDKNLKETWDQREKFARGQQWDDVKLEAWQAPITVNILDKILQWHISLLTDAPAKITITGKSEDDTTRPQMPDGSEGLSRVERTERFMDHKWGQLDMANRLAIAYSYALPICIGWLKVCINPNKKWLLPHGDPRNSKHWIRGDIDVPVIDPWHVGIDPTACWSANPIDVMDTAEYVIHSHMVSVRRLQRQYPDKAEQIEAAAGVKRDDLSPWAFRQVDPLKSAASQEAEYIPQANAAGSSANTGGNWQVPDKGPYKYAQTYDGKPAMVWECWMRDSDYPNGVVLTFVNDFLLMVRPNWHEQGQFPFVPIVINPLPGRLYGQGILHSLIPLQQALNKRHGQLMDWMNLAKGPMLTYPKGSFDDEDFVITPLGKIPYNGEQGPEFLVMPQLTPDAWRSMEVYERNIHEIAGIDESIMGGRLKAGTAGVAIEGMIDQAMQRIRMLDRWNVASRRRLGRLMLSVCQLLYRNTGYEARILGAGGHPQSLFLEADDFNADLDIDIQVDTARALKNESLFKKSMDLKASYGGFPIGEVVRLAGYENPDTVTKKIEEEVGLQQQLEQVSQELEALRQEYDKVAGQVAGPAPQPGGM